MVIVGIVGTLTVRSMTALMESRERVDHSLAVVQALDRLLIAIDDTETGHRGFVITGDSAYLEPHIQGAVRAKELMAQLRSLVASDSVQRSSMEDLARAATRKIEHSQRGVETMVRDGPAAARQVVASGEGRRYMDEVRAGVAAMQDPETTVLEQRLASAERSLVNAGLVAGLGLLTAALLAAISVMLMSKNLAAAERERRSATYAHELIDAASEGMYGLDSRGHVTFANRSMAAMLGYRKDELVGSHGHTLFHHTRADGSPYPVEECTIYRALTGDFAGDIDDEIIWRRDGTMLPVEYSVARVRDPEGNPGAVVSFRDITERREAHMALKLAMQTAEASNQAKSDFLARMSHELRTPLNSVIGFSNLLLHNKSGGLSEKDIVYIERIQKNGVNLLSLINDILDFSKIEAGKIELDIAPADLRAIVSDVVHQFETQVMGSVVKVVWSVPDRLPPIQTDAGRLRQVLVNLVGNAIKFTEAGTVSVSVIAHADTGDPARIEVADSGIGIPPERIGAIFDPFEQAERSTTRRFGGTGLGLPISKSLCELLGYDLRVTSREGQGSTFIIDLALRPVEKLSASVPQSFVRDPLTNGSPLAGKTVLVVDDAPDDRLLISAEIAELGGIPITASSGSEALELAREHKPDLITLDLLMPKMDGSEVLRLIKSDPDLCRIPVVIVSAVAKERQGLTGALSLLPKPLDPADLRHAVNQGIGLGRVLIVDDDPDAQTLLSSYAHDEGASEVLVAGDGESALSILDEFKPDLVLLDLVLPRRDGADVLARIASDPGQTPAVIIVTSKELSAGEARSLSLGSLGVLRKGEKLEDDLRAALRSFAAGRQQGSARSG